MLVSGLLGSDVLVKDLKHLKIAGKVRREAAEGHRVGPLEKTK